MERALEYAMNAAVPSTHTHSGATATLSPPKATPVLRRVRILFARALQILGWAGLAGLVLLLVAAVILVMAGYAPTHEPSTAQPLTTELEASALPAPTAHLATSQTAPVVSASPLAAQVPPSLAPLSDVPLLLTQIKHIATTNGLGWAAADYRITAATDIRPTSLEVRSNLKGPYPKLRSLIAQVLREVPNATLKELSLNRSNSDALDVEVKLVVAVFLQDPPASTEPLPAASTPARKAP